MGCGSRSLVCHQSSYLQISHSPRSDPTLRISYCFCWGTRPRKLRQMGHLGCVALLHDSGASVDSKEEVSWTPLAYAIGGHHIKVANYLLSQQDDPNATSSKGVSLLRLAKDHKFNEASTAPIKYHAALGAHPIHTSLP
jgi:hypothetical protein